MAVPAIEAWYLFGKDPSVSEASWEINRREGRFLHVRRELKVKAYGSATVSGVLLEQRALAEAHRLTASLGELERAFPGGFGALRRSLATWNE
jgi:hypothetical protein